MAGGPTPANLQAILHKSSPYGDEFPVRTTRTCLSNVNGQGVAGRLRNEIIRLVPETARTIPKSNTRRR
ncbi:hypothetical protein EGY31_08245 [Burkholderia multivorans]|nr:hypothetical protein EGY31_08245 [Burkholderia multivorans]